MRPKIHEFLKEDIGSGDITSELVVSPDLKARGRIVAKGKGVLAGAEEAAQVFTELGCAVTSMVRDGAAIEKGQAVLEVRGPARAVLAGERLALNFLMRMSGIATLTHDLVGRCRKVNPDVRVAATRKTTPGFREYEKKAVRLGGGDPHRMGLYDAVLIKDNQIRLAGGIGEALKKAKRGSFTKKIEIEVENRKEALAALEGGADIIMLDNFRPEEVKALSKELRKQRPEIIIEASGGIRPEEVEKYAEGADIVSLGWLTHSVKSLDFSMEMEKA